MSPALVYKWKDHALAPRPARRAGPRPRTPGTSPVPRSAAATVHAALTANPGATTAVIAADAGIERPAARDALAALEAVGAVTRTKGGKPGIPDTWALTTPGPAGSELAVGPGHDDGHVGGGQDGEKDGSGQQAEAGDPRQTLAATLAPTQPPSLAATLPRAVWPTRAAESHETASPADSSAPPAAPAPARDPALVAQIAGRIGQIQSAVSVAAALAGGGDLHEVRAGLDEIYEQAAQARRAVKAAAGETKAPAAQPGGLREKVLAHLRASPGSSFTPHEIHKVTGHSSGAIANALDTLVKHGDAREEQDPGK